jgi:hypothetical protein
MPLVIPRTQVSQVISSAVSPAVASPRYAIIVGPNYAVRGYSDAAKAAIRLGEYADAVTAFSWPGRQAGEIVDQDFTRVFIDNAKLRFVNEAIGSGASVAPVAGHANRIKSSTLAWATNAAATRSAEVPTDVLPGDYIEVSVGANILKTYVRALLPDVVAPVVAATDLTAVTPTQVAAATATKITTVSPSTLVVSASSAAAYDGSASGYATDTYTITVKVGGAPSSSKLTITSIGGDNVDDVTPTIGTPVAIGARGATVTFGSDTDFQAGEVWTLAVVQGYTRPTAASGGTFLGTDSTVYVAEVIRGGAINGNASTGALLQVSTLTNADSGPAFAPTSAVAAPIGSLGVTLTLTGTKLVKGNKFTIAVTPATDGALSTLELENNLPAALLGEADLKVVIAIEKNIEVIANRIGHAPLKNWTQSETQITLNSGILASDSRVIAGSVLTELPVIGGTAYAAYRALKTVGANVLGSVTPATADVAGAVLAAFGTTDPASELPFGVMCAAENSAGVTVNYIPVVSDDLAGYQKALASIAQTNPGWSLVPLSHDAAVQSLFRTTAASRSSAVSAKWCVAWLGGVLAEQTAVATKRADNSTLLATITDDTSASGTQNVIVTDTNGKFIDLGVRAGDVIRGAYSSDGFGGNSYAEYLVDAVLSNESVRLLSGPDTAVTLPAKYEIWRPLSVTEQAAAYGKQYGFGDRRARVVFPANPKRGGEAYPNYFLAASIAGLRSGVLPHQPLSSVQVLGWDDMSESSVTFADQLEALMNAGIWVVTQEYGTAMVYTLRQVTTDVSDLRNLEDSVVANLDSIAQTVMLRTAGITGKGNLTDGVLAKVGARLASTFEELKVVTDENLGGQVVDAVVKELRRNAVLRDHATAIYSVTVPTPFNNLDVTIEAVV